VIFLNHYNRELIFDIERIEGRFAANNKVHGENAEMIHEIHGNQIGELNAFVRVNTADLKCYPGFIGGDAFSGNTVSTFLS
jgi:hypothetical protein